MDKSPLKNSKNAFKSSQIEPLNDSQVTLHLEATEFFENRVLSISYTKNGGWNAEDITEFLPKLGEFQKLKREQTSMDLNASKKEKSFQPSLKNRKKTSQNEVLPKTSDSKKTEGESKVARLNRLFSSKSNDLAPNCYDTLPNFIPKKYKCNECVYTASKAMTVAEHFYVKHKPAVPFFCPYCQQRFSIRRLLKQHLTRQCKKIPKLDRLLFINKKPSCL